MKLRTGFVSNSSSSSFILSVQEDTKPCKHCGRRDIGLYELIESRNRYGDSDATEIKHRNKEEVLEGQMNLLKSFEEQLEDLRLRKDPNEKCFPGGWSTVGDYRKELVQYCKDTKELIAKIKKAKAVVFQCEVNYHDDVVNQMIKDLAAAGRCTILDEERE